MQGSGEQLDLFKNVKGAVKPSRDTGVTQDNVVTIEKAVLKIAKTHGLDVGCVKWKNNHRVMASVGKGGVLNLHTIYQYAERDDLLVLMNVMKGKAKNGEFESFKHYIDEHLPKELGECKSRLVVLPPKGVYHDLNKALKNVLPLLDKPIEKMPIVGWSPVRVGTLGITWGTHRDGSDGSVILLNAVLDDHDIPSFVVEHIVWHEICHEVLPPENGSNGRRRVHSREFREIEHRYPKARIAETWELKNVAMLIKRHLKRPKRRRR
jgi:hypothetical protein